MDRSVLTFGLNTFDDITNNPHGSPLSHAGVIREVIQEGIRADQAQVDSFGIGEHHRAERLGRPRDEAKRRLTEETANLYARRVFREVIQNAFDGAAGGSARILIRLDLCQGDDVPNVANEGRGFTRGNMDAVASPAMSI